jgi:radical SAM superfamily enzyme YgiQ (UPF0313 family)
MTLGILKIAAVLKQTGTPVNVIDLSGVKNFLDVICDYMEMYPNVRHFGITATTPQLPASVEIAELIRAKRKEARIILGGPHVTLASAAFKKEKKLGLSRRATIAMQKLKSAFDVLVAGDGEDTITLALADDAPKLIDADEPDSPLFLTNERLTELPFPARELVDVSSYRYTIDGVRAISLIAQLGCPFLCGFCGGRASPMLRRIRMRTSENIIEEMLLLHRQYGFNGFMFYDDELNVNPKMLELMRLIAKTQKNLGVEWRLRGFVKSQLFTDEQAEAMYQAGFRWILVGFESGAPSILEAINKRATRDENTRCMNIARRHGLKVKALMSMGHPGESPETVRETKEWLLSVKPDDFDLTIITCYPGTPYYDDAIPVPDMDGIWQYTYQKTGAKLYQIDVDFTRVAEYYKGDPEGGYHAYVYTDTLSPNDMVRLRNEAESEVRHLLDIPFNPSAPAMLYEHSMGQMGFSLPDNILRFSG